MNEDPLGSGETSAGNEGDWPPGRLVAAAGAVVVVGLVILLMWLNSGAVDCTECSAYQDITAVGASLVIFGFPIVLIMLLVLAAVRSRRRRGSS